ncbi:HAD family hydrolase [Candidatus Hodarchaeum mangrovi]
MKESKVIFFNGGGTLFQLKGTNLPSYYSHLLSEITGKEISPQLVFQAFSNAEHWALSRTNYSLFSDLDQRKYQNIFYNSLGFKNRKTINSIEKKLADMLQFDYILEEGAMEVLMHLKGKYRLGMISNWDESLLEILAELNILEFFESITYSEDVGTNKPSEEIFRIALSDFSGIKARETVYIADDYKTDIIPAMMLNMNVIFFDKGPRGMHGRPFQPEVRCPRITHLKEVLNYF